MSTDSTYIAVGVDGGPDAARAVIWAGGWASHLGRSLRIITAERSTGDQDALKDKLTGYAEAARAAIAQAFPDLPVEVAVSIDNPVSAMLDESEQAGAVVIGTRGTGGWRGTGMNSVAGSVAASSRCPTIVVPPAANENYDVTGDFVVGHDGSEAAATAARQTVERAERQGRNVRVVQAGDDDAHVSVEAAVDKLREAYPQVTINFVFGEESAEELLARESETAAALIVATRGHRGVPGFLPGPTTLYLLQHAKSPVVVHSGTNERPTPF